MTPFKPGDVVAVEFPFSDLQNFKRRPGLVLAADENDLLIARLTTHLPRESSDIALKHWTETGLPKASTVRLTKLATIDVRLIHHKVGKIHSEDAAAIFSAWQKIGNTFAAEFKK